jgi:tetratricopeptide (TPR) repeat protein
MRIIYWLAGRVPAQLFLTEFRPDWQTLPRIWNRYRSMGQSDDSTALLAYAVEATKRETKEKPAEQAAAIWAGQASMYRDVGRSEESLACLQRAYACAPTDFSVRLALANELAGAGRYAEAQPHYRWCRARRPTDQNLSDALKNIAKHNIAQRDLRFSNSPNVSSRLPPTAPAATAAAPHSSSPEQPQLR